MITSSSWGWFCLVLTGAAQDAPAAATSRPAFVRLLSQEEAWKSLPAPEQSNGAQPTPAVLPRWALATAKALPRTTAAMLELDWRHRAASPLDPVLRGQIRLVVAQANGCAYSQAQATYELRQAGQRDTEIRALLRDIDAAPVLSCARKLTLAAYTVTDAEIAELTRTHGDKQIVAIVQLVAFANFQDRLLLALGIDAETGGPLPPRDYRFSKDAKGMPRPAWPTAPTHSSSPRVDDADWRRFSFSDLKSQMKAQQERPPRIPVPSWDAAKKFLPPEAQKRELRIKWSLVCLGYQPELAQGWSACTRAFGTEAAMDRVFEESLFWVVTRTLQCFY